MASPLPFFDFLPPTCPIVPHNSSSDPSTTLVHPVTTHPASASPRTDLATVLVAAACLIAALALWRAQRVSPWKFPPTAPGATAVLGHLQLVEGSYVKRGKTADEIAKKMGTGIYTVKLGPSFENRKTVVVTNVEHARNLLEVQSAKTADRPDMPVVNAVTKGNELGFARYGDRFRLLRTGLGNQTRARKVEQYVPLQEFEATKFALQLADNPMDHKALTKRYTGSVALCSTFGLPSFDSASDAELADANRSMSRMLGTLQPEAFVANMIPELKHLPSWCPGATWKKTAAKWFDEDLDEFGRLMGELNKGRDAGESRPCIVQSLLDEGGRLGYSEEDGLYMAGTIFRDAFETTALATTFFLNSLLAHPDAQATAQAELDRVVGRERVPTLEDLPHLPYVQALVKEVARLYPVTPTGFPHAMNEDVVYDDWVLPKGTWVWPNVWSINRDPAVFPEPDAFKPERYLNEAGEIVNPPHTREFGHFQFGFGRRACPGAHFATNGLNAMAMTTLWAVRVVPTKEEREAGFGPETDELAWESKPPKFEVEDRFEGWREVMREHRRAYSEFMSKKDLEEL